MQLLSEFGESIALYRRGILSIGNFDGVHRGHRILLDQLVQTARRVSAPVVVLTFEPHPLEVLNPAQCLPRLTTLWKRAQLLGDAGVDLVFACPTTPELLAHTPEEFFFRIVRDGLDARGIVEGPNFNFGRDRSGTIDTLQELCRQAGLSCQIVGAANSGEEMISSSLIRRHLGQGRVIAAAECLGRPYAIQGIVSPGARRGRTIGFPTANVEDIATMIPSPGVYAGRCVTSQGTFDAAVHVGPNPTFAEGDPKVEAHLLEFTGDLYGETVEIVFIDRVRNVQTFSGPEELQTQLKSDVVRVAELLSETEM